MWETLCRGYSVNLQCEDSSCLPCGWSIAWFPQIHADFHRFYMIDKNRNPPLVLDADVSYEPLMAQPSENP